MSYWDSSALIKLYVQEFDSAAFRALAANATQVVTASLTRHEMRTVFRRRESRNSLPGMYANVPLRYSWDSRCCLDVRDSRVATAFTDSPLSLRCILDS